MLASRTAGRSGSVRPGAGPPSRTLDCTAPGRFTTSMPAACSSGAGGASTACPVQVAQRGAVDTGHQTGIGQGDRIGVVAVPPGSQGAAGDDAGLRERDGDPL